MRVAERFHIYSRRVTAVPGSARQTHESIYINSIPSTFHAHGLGFMGGGFFTVRCQDGRNRYFQSDQVKGTTFVDAEFANWLPLWPEIPFQFNTSFQYDVTNTNAAPQEYEIAIAGAHRLTAELPFHDLADANRRESSYKLTVNFTIGASGRLSLPLHPPMDVDFAIRTLVYHDPSGAAANLRIQIRDHLGQSFMNDFVNVKLLFAEAGSMVAPGVISPEIVIPAGQSFRIDLFEADGVAIAAPGAQLIFGGALLYA